MDLYPAIDLRGGHAVRLRQGDFSRETDYGAPLALARRFIDAGASWIHVVDLDAARTGVAGNRETIFAIAELAGGAGACVQAGGGVRTEGDVGTLLDGGVARVVLGTAAVEAPDLVARVASRYPGKVAVGLDYRRADGRSEVAVGGWEAGSGRSVTDLLDELRPLELGAVVVTAIERDGTLEGPEIDGLVEVLRTTSLPVVASGGVATVAHLTALAHLAVGAGDGVRRLAGAITGKALADGRVTIEEALAACTASG